MKVYCQSGWPVKVQGYPPRTGSTSRPCSIPCVDPSGGRTIQTASVRASLSDRYLDRLTQGKGRVILTASAANEVSIEKDDVRHGIFTYYLLESFRLGDLDGDRIITAGEAFRYVSRKVPDATDQNQHPVKKGEETEGEITIGKWVSEGMP